MYKLGYRKNQVKESVFALRQIYITLLSDVILNKRMCL